MDARRIAQEIGFAKVVESGIFNGACIATNAMGHGQHSFVEQRNLGKTSLRLERAEVEVAHAAGKRRSV
jgi:hypothetical protein